MINKFQSKRSQEKYLAEKKEQNHFHNFYAGSAGLCLMERVKQQAEDYKIEIFVFSVVFRCLLISHLILFPNLK